MSSPRVIKSLPISAAPTRQVIRVGHSDEPEFIASGDHSPEVECITENGVVRRIQIRCSCGTLTTLVCQYAE